MKTSTQRLSFLVLAAASLLAFKTEAGQATSTIGVSVTVVRNDSAAGFPAAASTASVVIKSTPQGIVLGGAAGIAHTISLREVLSVDSKEEAVKAVPGKFYQDAARTKVFGETEESRVTQITTGEDLVTPVFVGVLSGAAQAVSRVVIATIEF